MASGNAASLASILLRCNSGERRGFVAGLALGHALLSILRVAPLLPELTRDEHESVAEETATAVTTAFTSFSSG
jgi:hypothetical protein